MPGADALAEVGGRFASRGFRAVGHLLWDFARLREHRQRKRNARASGERPRAKERKRALGLAEGWGAERAQEGGASEGAQEGDASEGALMAAALPRPTAAPPRQSAGGGLPAVRTLQTAGADRSPRRQTDAAPRFGLSRAIPLRRANPSRGGVGAPALPHCGGLPVTARPRAIAVARASEPSASPGALQNCPGRGGRASVTGRVGVRRRERSPGGAAGDRGAGSGGVALRVRLGKGGSALRACDGRGVAALRVRTDRREVAPLGCAGGREVALRARAGGDEVAPSAGARVLRASKNHGGGGRGRRPRRRGRRGRWPP